MRTPFGTLIVLALLVAGCGGGGSSAGRARARVVVTMTWPARQTRLVPDAASSILVTLRNAALRTTRSIVIARPAGSGGATDEAVFDDVFAAPGYTVTAEAKPGEDGTGVTQAADASPAFEVVAGQDNTFGVVTMRSAVTRMTLTAASTGARYLYAIDPATGVVNQVADAAGYQSDRYTLNVGDAVTVDTRNAENELVLVDPGSGVREPISATGVGLDVTGATRLASASAMSFDLVGTESREDGVLSVSYQDAPDRDHPAGFVRTFDLPVRVAR